jgi:hypothetical protein
MRKKKRLVLDDSKDRLLSREAFRKFEVTLYITDSYGEEKKRMRDHRWRE